MNPKELNHYICFKGGAIIESEDFVFMCFFHKKNKTLLASIKPKSGNKETSLAFNFDKKNSIKLVYVNVPSENRALGLTTILLGIALNIVSILFPMTPVRLRTYMNDPAIVDYEQSDIENFWSILGGTISVSEEFYDIKLSGVDYSQFHEGLLSLSDLKHKPQITYKKNIINLKKGHEDFKKLLINKEISDVDDIDARLNAYEEKTFKHQPLLTGIIFVISALIFFLIEYFYINLPWVNIVVVMVFER
jgi:hypothetical protein